VRPDEGEQVHRDQVHEVHHENPAEHGQRHGSDQLAALGVVDHGLGLAFHHFHQNFNGGLKTARHAGSGTARRLPQGEAHQNAENDVDDHRIDVHDGKVDNAFCLPVAR
jgi:hypothetical protein